MRNICTLKTRRAPRAGAQLAGAPNRAETTLEQQPGLLGVKNELGVLEQRQSVEEQVKVLSEII